MSMLRRLSGVLLLWAACDHDPTERIVAPAVPPPVPLPPAIHIVLRDGDSMMPMPGRVIVYPTGATPKPDFKSDGATASVLAPFVIGSPEGVLLATGDGTVGVPAGTYDLLLLQGTEYESVRKSVTVGTDAVTEVDVTLEHTVKTGGWLAADMHIHTRQSFDSKLLAAHRVISEVSSGVQVIVPTEHGYHYDLTSILKTLDYGVRAVSIPGSEYNFQGGHAGIYPVVYDPTGPLLGAPPWQEWPKPNMADPETYFPLIHQQAGSPLVVINHPRLPPDLGYFLNIRWRPGMPLSTAGLFDGIEVLNGYAMRPFEVAELLQDWFALLNQGVRVTALGNSDTHRIDWLRAGYPRTWLGLPTSEPARLLPSDLREAIVKMRAVASNGPFVQLTIDGKALGETVSVQAGRVQATITADAPAWIDLTRLQIYRNGVLHQEIPITSRTHPALKVDVKIDVPTDGWIVVLALGDAGLPVDVIGAVNGGQALPIALTNPIWLDADGDGKVKAVGVVPPRPVPWKQAMLRGDEDRAQLLLPLHAPLDCEPFEYPDWLH
jgi:hypothetical protein